MINYENYQINDITKDATKNLNFGIMPKVLYVDKGKILYFRSFIKSGELYNLHSSTGPSDIIMSKNGKHQMNYHYLHNAVTKETFLKLTSLIKQLEERYPGYFTFESFDNPISYSTDVEAIINLIKKNIPDDEIIKKMKPHHIGVKTNKKVQTSDKLKIELKQAVLRGVVKKIKMLLVAAVADLISKDVDHPKAKDTAFEMLKTPFGSAIFSIGLGTVLPSVSNQIPEEYRKYVDVAAKELRISGGEDVICEISEVVATTASTMVSSIKSSLSQLKSFDDKSLNMVRVDVSQKKKVPVTQELVEVAVDGNSGGNSRKN